MFNSKPEEITFERIEAFCKEQNPEGETIEYKGDFPSNLEKSISAMANTHGGIIFIGVRADKTRNTPIMPIEGIELTEGLEEKVTSICLRRIHHPYIPWVKVCPFKNDKDEDKCIVFIRVYESDQTPHAINNNTDVYLRIRSQNEPFKKATIDEVEWLKNRRQRAIENRQTLIKTAEQRFRNMPYDPSDNLKAQTGSVDLYSPSREVSVIPLFPNKPLLKYTDLLTLRNTFNSSLDQVFYLATPASCSGSLSCPLVQHDDSGYPVRINYTEFNIFGLVFNKQTLWENLYAETQELFDVSFFLQQIFRVVTVGTTIYEKTGYFGNIQIEVKVGGIRGKRICVVENQRERHHWCVNRIERNFHITRICSFYQLNGDLDGTLIEICKKFLWSCGAGEAVKSTETILKNLCKRAREFYQ